MFTETLVVELQKHGLRAEITWLPHRAEYAPWTVHVPKPPIWANIVHVNTWLHPRFIPKGLPVVATLHHSIHHPDLAPYKGLLRAAYHKNWIRRIEHTTMRRAERVTAVSRFAAECARATLPGCPIEVIPNGVDVQRFRPPSEPRVPHSPFRLLYLGSWTARKGVDLLPAIMRKLGGGFELRYTGGVAADKDRATMPSNMRDLGHLQGSDAVVAAMQDADAFLFPSRSEGLPLSVLEAKACGLPVVATRGSSLVEVVEDGVTGILCPQNDVTAFAAAVRTLSKDANRTAVLSNAARQYAVSRFSVGRMVDAYIHLYIGFINYQQPISR